MKYAVIAECGKQYKVSEGDVIKVEKLGVAVGETVTFNNVLLISDGETVVGNPTVAGASVTASVVTSSVVASSVVVSFSVVTSSTVVTS